MVTPINAYSPTSSLGRNRHYRNGQLPKHHVHRSDENKSRRCSVVIMRTLYGRRRILLLGMLLSVLSWAVLFLYTQSSDAFQKMADAAFYYEVLSKQQNNLPASREVVIPADVKVSVIVMNHGRPYMLKKSNLMPTLLAHPSIDQVMICHSNSKTKFDYDHPKVTNIDAIEANKQMGLSLRFHFCQEAKNPWVMIVDDDQEISNSAIDQLLSEFVANPKRIVGKFGRGYSFWSAPWRYGYNTKNIMGDVEVVLTKFMVLERQLCHRFFEYSHLISDLLPESKPLWNAEDIFMSLTANHVYNVPFSGPYNNYAMPLDVWEAPDASYKDGGGVVDNVSGNLDRITWYKDGLRSYMNAYSKATDHTRYRGRLWYNAKRRLAALNDTVAR